MNNKKTTNGLRNRAPKLSVGKTIYVSENYSPSRHATFCTTLRRIASAMGKNVKFSVSKTRTNKYCIKRVS